MQTKQKILDILKRPCYSRQGKASTHVPVWLTHTARKNSPIRHKTPQKKQSETSIKPPTKQANSPCFLSVGRETKLETPLSYADYDPKYDFLKTKTICLTSFSQTKHYPRQPTIKTPDCIDPLHQKCKRTVKTATSSPRKPFSRPQTATKKSQDQTFVTLSTKELPSTKSQKSIGFSFDSKPGRPELFEKEVVDVLYDYNYTVNKKKLSVGVPNFAKTSYRKPFRTNQSSIEVNYDKAITGFQRTMPRTKVHSFSYKQIKPQCSEPLNSPKPKAKPPSICLSNKKPQKSKKPQETSQPLLIGKEHIQVIKKKLSSKYI